MRVNIEEKTRALNEFRVEASNKSFTYGELKDIFKEKNITNDPMTLSGILRLFPFEKIGKNKIYEVPKNPIHVSLVKKIWASRADYQKKNKEKNKEKEKVVDNTPSIEISEESALAVLAAKGYQIRKCVGFDLERFSKENPILYKKYLKYEII